MKTRIAIVLIALAVQTAGCEKAKTDFEMPIEQVDVLQGFILKGISISGEVKSGCIANEDEFVIKRNGKEILRTTTRILNIRDLEDPDSFNGEAAEGDYVTLYIPDGKEDDVNLGDILSSSSTTCKASEK